MSCTGNQLNYGNTFVKGICLGTLVPSTVPNTVPSHFAEELIKVAGRVVVGSIVLLL